LRKRLGEVSAAAVDTHDGNNDLVTGCHFATDGKIDDCHPGSGQGCRTDKIPAMHGFALHMANELVRLKINFKSFSWTADTNKKILSAIGKDFNYKDVSMI
jgi:hypothetical protein